MKQDFLLQMYVIYIYLFIYSRDTIIDIFSMRISPCVNEPFKTQIFYNFVETRVVKNTPEIAIRIKGQFQNL